MSEQPNEPKNDFPNVIFGQIFETLGKQAAEDMAKEFGKNLGKNIIKNVKDGGIKAGEAGLNKARSIRFEDVVGGVNGFINSHLPTDEKPAAPKPVKVTKPAAPKPPVIKVEVPVVNVEPPVTVKPTPPAPAFAKTESETAERAEQANKSLDAIYQIALDSSLSTADRNTLVSSVIKLIELSSESGFTAEHARWIARLYGNKEL